MNVFVTHPSKTCHGTIQITGSKSESNRLLLLQALYPSFLIENGSNSNDSELMRKALRSSETEIDVYHAGTAMRFLTAFFATQPGREIILTGSERMQERPIKILVDALRHLGADIEYVYNDGYPPLKIKGKKLHGQAVSLPANVSSQYISALMLIAAALPNGLSIKLLGQITSIPYIKMTQALLERVGIEVTFDGNTIYVGPAGEIHSQIQYVESDWSSASYYFSIVALSKSGQIRLRNYRKDSIQGDAILQTIYKDLGVNSHFEDAHTLVLSKSGDDILPRAISLDLTKAPDIAQTIAVTCYGLGIGCELTGLHTLKIKETDRLEALNTELTKLGANIKVTHNSLSLGAGNNFKENCSIPTYHDHRMAMAFAPLALKVPLIIESYDVVTKSYPDFWDDLETIGFVLEKR